MQNPSEGSRWQDGADTAQDYGRGEAEDLVDRLGQLVQAQPAGADDIAPNLRQMSDIEVIGVLRSLDPQLLLEALRYWLPVHEGSQPRTTVPSQALVDEDADQRSYNRYRVLRAGKLVYNNKMCVIDCDIKDMSERGCRVSVVSTTGIPDYFVMHIQGSDQKYECQVAWRTADEMGMRFVI